MEYQLHIKLLSQELTNKVEAMRNAGLNPSALVRNFLKSYKLPRQAKESA